MSHPILGTGAAGGAQGSTGRQIASFLLEQGIPVRDGLGRHALDRLTRFWQTLRKGEERYQPTDGVRAVTGRNSQTVEEFFRDARFFGATQEA